MPTSDSRSHNGCWTCRARRKKCDESSLPCSTCNGLSLTCYGFGPRPSWMDGGVQEKSMVNDFKATVKQSLKQRRRLRAFSQGASGLDPGTVEMPRFIRLGSESAATSVQDMRRSRPSHLDEVSSSFSPESPPVAALTALPSASFSFDFDLGAFDQGLSIPPSAAFGNIDLVDLQLFDASSTSDTLGHPSLLPVETYISPTNTRTPIVPDTPNSALDPSDTTLDELFALSPRITSFGSGDSAIVLTGSDNTTDTDVVHHYMRWIFSTQFPFAEEDLRGKVSPQLLALAARSHACQAAIGLHGLSRTCYRLGVLTLPATQDEKAERFLEHAKLHLEDIATAQLFASADELAKQDDFRNLEAQLCAAQVISWKVMSRDDSWTTQVDSLASLKSLDYSKAAAGIGSKVEIMQSLLVTMDILAATSTGRYPIFARTWFGESQHFQTPLECVSGCTTAVMRVIMAIDELQAWKDGQIQSGSVSLLELARRGLKLESDLADARQHIPHRSDSFQDIVTAITNVYVKAASVYLHATVSGAHPDVDEIRRDVTETIDALHSLPSAETVMLLSWPICIAACMADGEHRKTFESIERGIIDEFGKGQRVLRAFAVARECWRLREANGSGQGYKAYDWRASMASLGQMVLLL